MLPIAKRSSLLVQSVKKKFYCAYVSGLVFERYGEKKILLFRF